MSALYLHAAGSKQLSVRRPAVAGAGSTASHSSERHPSARAGWIIMKSLVVVQSQTGIPFIGTHAGTVSHWLTGAELDSVNATHVLPPVFLLSTHPLIPPPHHF